MRETVINFDIAAGANNFLQPGFSDDPFPGYPGNQTLDSDTGNTTEEVLTYLEFPAAGVNEMGVNSDDDFQSQFSASPAGQSAESHSRLQGRGVPGESKRLCLAVHRGQLRYSAHRAAQPGGERRHLQTRVQCQDLAAGVSNRRRRPTQANNNEWAEGVLARLVGNNVANRTGFVNGVYAEPKRSTTSTPPAKTMATSRRTAGIPGTGSATATAATDNNASEFVTCIPFAAPGLFTLGVNRDDNFRVTVAEQVGRQQLQVLAPAGIAGGLAAVPTSIPMNVNPGSGGPLPTTPTGNIHAVARNPKRQSCDHLLRHAAISE